MSKNNFVYLVSVLFLIIGIMHVLRIANEWEAQLGTLVVPMWASYLAALVALYISFQGFRLAKK